MKWRILRESHSAGLATTLLLSRQAPGLPSCKIHTTIPNMPNRPPIARPANQDRTVTEPNIPRSPGTTGWWLYLDTDGRHTAMPMRATTLNGAWPDNMTWTYEPAEVRAWLQRNR